MLMTEDIEFNKVLVVSHPRIKRAEEDTRQITAYLENQGLEVKTCLLGDHGLQNHVQIGAYDLFIALGGDGTMLRAGHICGPFNVPILGINLGRFGFLTEIGEEEWEASLNQLLRGEYWLERRMMLETILHREGAVYDRWEALNDAVISRGRIIRPIQLETHVDGRFLSTYVADGIIVSTATGSTAYAMAAGGPILPPELRNILLVPVAPHLSIEQAIVLAEGSVVSLEARSEHEAVLSIDGQPPVDLQPGDTIEIRASQHTVPFVRFEDPGYFYRNLTPHMSRNPSIGKKND